MTSLTNLEQHLYEVVRIARARLKIHGEAKTYLSLLDDAIALCMAQDEDGVDPRDIEDRRGDALYREWKDAKS